MSGDVDLSRAPLLSHLLELRRRLMWLLLCFALAFAVSYHFADHLYRFLTAPLYAAYGDGEQHRMIYTGLHEAFVTYLRLAVFAALLVTVPFALNQLWKFLAPGLYQHERSALRPFFILTPALFLLGAAAAYYVVFPLAWKFFLGFESLPGADGIAMELEPRVSEYLNLVTALIMAFGLSFELPVALLLAARLGLVTADDLAHYRRHAIVLIFAFAAVATPPDVISQITLGTPLVLLYEVSIIAIRRIAARSAMPRAALR